MILLFRVVVYLKVPSTVIHTLKVTVPEYNMEHADIIMEVGSIPTSMFPGQTYGSSRPGPSKGQEK